MITSKVFDATKLDLFHCYGKSIACMTPYTFFIHYDGDENIKSLPIHGKSGQCGFSSCEEAEKARKEYIAKEISDNTIFVVLKNADFTEGRGPMLLHKTFKKISTAHSYIMRQKGIYGSPQYYKISFGVNIYGELYGSISYNGYDLIITNLITE